MMKYNMGALGPQKRLSYYQVLPVGPGVTSITIDVLMRRKSMAQVYTDTRNERNMGPFVLSD